MPPKRATRSTPASTAPESIPAQRTRGRPRRNKGAGAVADEPGRGMATRARAAAKPSSSAPAAPAKDRGSLTADPIPRKGPPRDVAKSEFNIFTSPNRGQANSESPSPRFDAEFVADAEPGSEEDSGAGDRQAESGAQIEVEDAPFMCQGIQKLADAAESIFTKYRDLFTKYRVILDKMKDNGTLAKDSLSGADKAQLQRYKTQLRFFEMDMGAFTSMRNHLVVHESYAPFLHWLWLDRQMPDDEAKVLKHFLIPTNLATLVDIVYAGAKNELREAGEADVNALRILDDNFEDLFLGGRLLPLTNAMVDLALDVRQAYLLAALSTAKYNSEARRIVYDVFCGQLVEPSEKQLNNTLAKGPYRLVAGLDNDLVQQRCRTRVVGFLKHIAENGATFANLASHRGRFPAQNFLASIQAVYDQELSKPIQIARLAWARLQDPVAPAGNDAASEQAEEFHDAADELQASADESSGDEESQPITRVPNAEADLPLFHSAADLRDLHGLQHSSPVVPPPSNQQASAHGRILAAGHAAAPLPSTLSHRRRRSRSSPPSSPIAHRKRAHQQVSDDRPPATGDNEDDDAFETDDRSVNEDAIREKRRRHLDAMEAERLALAVVKQQHQNEPYPHSTPPMSTSTTAVGGLTQRSELQRHVIEAPRPAASQSRNTTTTVADYRNQPRPAFHEGGVRRRYPWSSHDEQVLIRSVAQHYGKWSRIEEECRELFEHPRDQQAYRDKARLMKTKMLVADMPLPPGFNHVALGAKEKREVIKAGKNPLRKETDVDIATGQVTNTEFVPGQAL
ncbi:hypothetical protein LEL_07448 [Akanthomyces lecanii RCEF 1005]|uniref:Myb-like domain-containing protein n=1 Tax=Akanthomyces lecanii RCEF 1005 TaxID=1081108 RepID=A0A168FPL3_CORDF|nr:hypothetical protein LEL_07448 [Akanthomyces lecanii RCEF 1005]